MIVILVQRENSQLLSLSLELPKFIIFTDKIHYLKASFPVTVHLT